MQTYEEAEWTSILQQELESYFLDLKDELAALRTVIFMCASYVHKNYTGYKYHPLNNMGVKTKHRLDKFQMDINLLLDEIGTAIEDIYEVEVDEPDLLDESPYDGMSKAEYKEEMFNQAADFFYESRRDEALDND